MRKPALPALTGLRTVLAVSVMFFHFTPPHPAFLTPLLNNAYVFVGFFFLISGFVLAYNYADRPVLARRRFYIARFSRVYPTYALVLLLSIPFLQIEYQTYNHLRFVRGLILTPLALQAWSPMVATFWNTVAWTVPAEFALYAVFPFLLLYFAKHGRSLGTPARLIGAIVALWIAGMVPHTLYLLLNPDHLAVAADRYTSAFWLRALKFSPPAYFTTFTAGVLLARLHALTPHTGLRRPLLACSAIIGLGLFFAFAVERVPYVLTHGTLLLPLFAMLLLGLAGTNPIASVFAWPPLVKMGETTFALYLLHFNAFLLIHSWHLPERLHAVRLDPWISYVAIIALAFAVRRLFEAPARAFVLRVLATAD